MGKPSVGMTAAKGLATRLQSEGVSVSIIAPARGTDWLDRLNAMKAGLTSIGIGPPFSPPWSVEELTPVLWSATDVGTGIIASRGKNSPKEATKS